MATLVSDLVAQVRLRTDTVNSQFVTDAELTAYINSALGELYDLAVQKYDDAFITSVNTTIAASDPIAGTNFFNLPADFLSSRGVDILLNGTWATLAPFAQTQRNVYAFPLVVLPFGYLAQFYRIAAGKCYVIPAQNAAGYTYRLWYVPRLATLDISDNIHDHLDTNGWTEFCICEAASRVLLKQDLDASVFIQQKGAQQMRVLNAMSNRDAGPPKRMIDTRALSVTRGWGWGEGGGNV